MSAFKESPVIGKKTENLCLKIFFFFFFKLYYIGSLTYIF